MLKFNQCLLCEIDIISIRRLTLPICRDENCYRVYKCMQKGKDEFKCYNCKELITFPTHKGFIASKGKRIMPTLTNFVCGLECLKMIKHPMRLQVMKKRLYVRPCHSCNIDFLTDSRLNYLCKNIECQKFNSLQKYKLPTPTNWQEPTLTLDLK